MQHVRQRLTPKTARDLRAGQKLYDHEVVGLRLRAHETCKSWHLRYTTHSGADREKKLGRFPEMSVDRARRVAKELKDRVALGQDPVADWKAARGVPTVNDLCDRYINEWMPRRRIGANTIKQHMQLIDCNIRPGLGRKRVTDITTQMIDQFLKDVYDRKFVPAEKRPNHGVTAYWTALHTKRLVAKLFGPIAEYFDIELPKNPLRGTAPYGRRRRKRHGRVDELPRIAAELDRLAVEHPRRAACIWTLFLTGGRVSEILNAKGCNLQVRPGDHQVVNLEQHKTARFIGDKDIALPTVAREILAALGPIRPGERVFGEMSLRRFQAVWADVRARAGCPDLKLLDARRTFASFALSNGVSLDAVGELLHHEDVQTTKGYAYLLAEIRRRHTETTANAIMGAARPQSRSSGESSSGSDSTGSMSSASRLTGDEGGAEAAAG
jgi:integrase